MMPYRNKKWLTKKYINKALSVPGIANLCGVSPTTIRNWLIKFNISIRSRSETNHLASTNHCKLSKNAIEWINGELLGDGHICSKYKNSAKIQYSSKHLEYINYVSEILNYFGIEKAGKIQTIQHYGNDYYKYDSRAYVELLPIHKHWYPNGKKIVPRDIILTPLTIRQWYIGDGYLQHRKNRIGGRARIILYTCGFTISDVEWLIEELKNFGFKVSRQINKNAIYISTHSTKAFLKYIGGCPVKCYQYKWAY